MEYTKEHPLRVGTLCSGYDSQCLALERLKEKYPDFDYELVFWSDISKYAIQAHNAIFPQWADRNLGDMKEIDWSKVPSVDLLTYSTPCQDFSLAGQRRGGKKALEHAVLSFGTHEMLCLHFALNSYLWRMLKVCSRRLPYQHS